MAAVSTRRAASNVSAMLALSSLQMGKTVLVSESGCKNNAALYIKAS